MSTQQSTGLLLQGVTAGYRNRRVIEGFDLPALPPGTLLGLLGQNAAGKSTLLRGIAGLGRASGTIALDGVSLPALSAARRAALVGYLPQSLPSPSPLVAYEAVLSACRAVRGDLSHAQAEAAIARAFQNLGITHLALRRMSELSGGQRQMVGLAQVMVREQAAAAGRAHQRAGPALAAFRGAGGAGCGAGERRHRHRRHPRHQPGHPRLRPGGGAGQGPTAGRRPTGRGGDAGSAGGILRRRQPGGSLLPGRARGAGGPGAVGGLGRPEAPARDADASLR
ncbi:ATP-binding cassette domain-containing protein [Pseudoroseomonas wenyumeiae]